ncbi:cytochrome c3 family protein [Pseudodesulfovibrio indicus]|uniref:cytochrome c3 family protein n=1 Tax=Pseudodesulfovibrio indicus TaxID=1716143 RepID=UPI00292FF4B2|nr:cytochrome c3 family protein [Pseudodesulfovibrio indicus]
MFRKILLMATAAALAVALVGVALAYEVPDKVKLERPKNNKKLNSWVTAVDFPHGFHAIRVPCNGCHHKETDKTLGQFVGCRQCHSSDDPADANGFYRAWHSDGPPSCLGCHTRMRTEGGKNPVGCTTACHKPS